MTAVFIPGTAPSYQILSTDISSSGSATGCVYKGAIVLATDTGKYYRVLDTLVLQEVGTASLGASEAHIGQTGSVSYVATASFAGVGAATLHAANTHVAPLAGGVITIPNAVRVAGGSAFIMDISLTTSASSTVIVPRIHFFSASTVTVAADSGSWIELYADDANDIGYYTLPAMVAASVSSTCAKSTSMDSSTTSHPAILAKALASSRNLYAALETRTAFTTSASQLWNLKLRMYQD